MDGIVTQRDVREMQEVNVDVNYFEHPSTIRLVDRLGRGSDVLPLRLWAFTAKFYAAKRGRLTGLTAREIELKIGWWGKGGECVKAMTNPAIGFLERDGPTFVVHNFLERNGHLLTAHLRAKKAANTRWDAERAKNAEMLQASPSIAQASASICPTSTPSTVRANPPDPPGNGLVENPVGGLGRELGREGKEFERMAAVQSALAEVGVNGDKLRELSQRKDVTPARVRREIADIRRDLKVQDLAATLVYRLSK